VFHRKGSHGFGTALVLLALVGVAVRCSGSQRPTQPATCDLPQNIQMVLRGSERLNPRESDNQSLPVVVRIYQLKSSAKMEQAEFRDIWQRDRDYLGEDLVKVEEMYLYPGQRLARAFRREAAATHVVAVAIFRHPQGTAWRTIYELPPPPGEERCAAQQTDPNASAPPVREPRYYFFLEDYYIEAAGDDPIDDAGVSDVLRLPSTLPSIPSVPQPPSVPSLPSAPSLPSVPSAPSLPSAPSAPSLPSAPSAPSVPVPRKVTAVELVAPTSLIAERTA